MVTGIDYFTLASLKLGEVHGYELTKRVATLAQGQLKASAGSVYPALERLAKLGLVESRWGDPEEEGAKARRKYFRITPTGLKALAQANEVHAEILRLQGGEVI